VIAAGGVEYFRIQGVTVSRYAWNQNPGLLNWLASL
jgi:hypothetical protein